MTAPFSAFRSADTTATAGAKLKRTLPASTMAPHDIYVDNAWDWTVPDSSKPEDQKFFEGYAQAVNTRKFAESPLTIWYSSKTRFRSETGAVFNGAVEMKVWMTELFFSFEKIDHAAEYYMRYKDGEEYKVHAGFRRRLWLKGNTSDVPDTETPVAWVTVIGPADEPEGYLGLQFKDTNIYWDKTKTVGLLKKALPSDRQ